MASLADLIMQMNGQDQPDFLSTLAPNDLEPAKLTSRGIQETLGAVQPNNGGTVMDILAKRFQPTMDDNSNALLSTMLGKFATGQTMADDRANTYVKQLSTIGAMQKLAGTNAGGATGELVDRLQKENPGMKFGDALYQVQTGYRKGMTLDATGNVVPMAGYPGAIKDVKSAESSGTESGKLTADAQNTLPDVLDQASLAKKYVGEALNSPGLDANFGMAGVIPNRPGSEASTAHSILQQIQGGTFMNAYTQLRGGGQISDKEGDKAQSAVFRMQTAQSGDAFRSAAKDYFDVLDLGIARAKNKASGAVFKPGYQPQSNSVHWDDLQ